MEKFLVVEDDAAFNNFLREILTYMGFEVITTDSGARAVDLARRYRPRLITLDVNMPGIDGHQTLAQMRNIPELAKTPVLFISATLSGFSSLTYYSSDRVGFIEKSTVPEDLITSINRILKMTELAKVY